MLRTLLLSAALSCGLTGAGLLSSAAQAESMMNQIIYSKCSTSMSDDYKAAGITPATGFVDKMCSCVVQEINRLHNIEAAKTVCKANLGDGSN